MRSAAAATYRSSSNNRQGQNEFQAGDVCEAARANVCSPGSVRFDA
jgi:hypothetical protein